MRESPSTKSNRWGIFFPRRGDREEVGYDVPLGKAVTLSYPQSLEHPRHRTDGVAYAVAHSLHPFDDVLHPRQPTGPDVGL